MPPSRLVRGASLAALLLALDPGPDALTAQAGAKARPARYALVTGSYGRMLAGRVDYGMNSRGEIGVEQCCDFNNYGTWPRGTFNQYMYNSGPQVAAIIGGTRPTNPWAGDTTAGLFLDLSGLRQHGTGVTEVFNAGLAYDRERWPQAGYVPYGDDRFAAVLQGRASASDGDLWWLAWEGDPGLNAARPHPLGVAAEFRVMGWDAPRGIEDVMVVQVTFHNITARDAAAYAHHRPGLREQLAELGERFHQLNEEEFAVDLPDGGWSLEQFHANIAADPDVTYSAGINFASVNLPLAMGYAWHADFPRATGWSFPAGVFSPPFFSGSGLVGIQQLESLRGPPELQLYSNFTGGGAFPSPNSAVRAFKYFAGAVTPADGISCNHGDPVTSRICFIHNATPVDVRFMASSPPVTLAPGQSATIAWAYVHAAPVAIPGFQQGQRVFPGDPTRLSNASALAIGANRIDSIAGFTGFTDHNGDGMVQGAELGAVRGSLIAKAQLAQALYDNRFLVPQPPEPPAFFLIPGDRTVTVVWRPSATETIGDPYYQVARDASVVPSGGGAPLPNPLYDANYRQFDVEGYRVWRGRTDRPESLELVAQYDRDDTVFRDYTGQVLSFARGGRCAPELGETSSCADTFDAPGPGVQLGRFVEYSLAWDPLVQVATGDRVLLPGADVFVLAADTAFAGPDPARSTLRDTGVPFVHVDRGVQNGLTYFYAVTAFDVNAVNSTGAGRTSLESARVTRRVTPRGDAANRVVALDVESGVYGRNGRLSDTELPVLDPNDGRFSKRFPPSDALRLELTALVPELLRGEGEVAITFDSSVTTGFQAASSVDATYHYTITTPAGGQRLAIPVRQSATSLTTYAGGRFAALEADPELAARYLAPPGSYQTEASYGLSFPSGYYGTVRSRGCVNHAGGFPSFGACAYNGPRWFHGPNETVPHPNSSNPDRFNTGLPRVEFNNVGGGLPGVATIFEPRAYDDYSNTWRDVEAVLLPYQTAADYRVYWGTGGTIDSVIDVTHDVVVPFSERIGNSWGILNRAATQNGATYLDLRSELTVTDAGCVEPLRTLNPGGIACSGPAAALSRTALPGPVAFGANGNTVNERLAPPRGEGFVLYLKGHLFMVELEFGTVLAGRVWTLRDYVGAIGGGIGRAGDALPYTFTSQSQPRPFTAVGASVRFRYRATNTVVASTAGTLARVRAVPDPYYGAAAGGEAPPGVTFMELPAVAEVRIYSTSGVLVRLLRHQGPTDGGDLTWDLRNRSARRVAGGVYFYHVTAENGQSAVGRMTIVNP